MPSTPKEETQVGIYHIINRGNMHMQVFDWVNYVNTPQSQKELDKIRNSVFATLAGYFFENNGTDYFYHNFFSCLGLPYFNHPVFTTNWRLSINTVSNFI
jgi:hypothetical protein